MIASLFEVEASPICPVSSSDFLFLLCPNRNLPGSYLSSSGLIEKPSQMSLDSGGQDLLE